MIPPKKPKLTKAERRALQEQQRAAKAAKSRDDETRKSSDAEPSSALASDQKKKPSSRGTAAATEPILVTASETRNNDRKQHDGHISLVSHLSPYRDPQETFEIGARLTLKKQDGSSEGLLLPQPVLELGYKYATGKIQGSNARCRAMLRCFDQVLQEYEPDLSSPDIRQAFDQKVLKPSFQFWTTQCRPHSVSMGNAFTFLKTAIAALDREISLEQLRTEIHETILAYIQERIDIAGQAIASLCNEKLIQQNEVLLTFGYSEVMMKVLQHAWEQNKRFRVIVVDSRPVFGGRILLESLRKLGIPCTYILLNAVTYALPEVTKVLLGSSALMSDGAVWSPVGTAPVALAAHVHQIPVLVCSETYKISNRVQLESLTNNELGNPHIFQKGKENASKEASSSEQMLPLLYDLTPAEFVSGVVTEMGIVPPTSVAVLLREMNSSTK